ncbi:response regulator containing CheY-like receiver domain and AraC-type DNA-binding domain [Aequorivita sublithincola DSM 14238]|uniref:Response regulator containing CheY-like receiver domain and AraC-type DNA-binding domain n=1 Tax=Aequorivita sublithincola (strain DSM 14238 / LMG 21431 / ACAM 643 / 9-3) TaxID=746697 RepID=I3YUW9_AEQSU|nr:helix-turn-helix domain-containing protein [Aequorivita sublithincola]AFL80787.1 response regulator containing CheY-like receiver domain and AraC-type DNA-binding domain [Aequorivita sublithincola DSM 14238]
MNFIKKLLLFCFFFNCSFFLGQERTDLSQLSYEAISDTINKYLDNDIIKAANASNAFILKAKRAKDKKKEFLGIQALGSAYERNKDFDKAQEQFERALNFSQENKLEEEIISSYVLGAQIEMGLSNASNALKYLDTALSLVEQTDNEFLREGILQFISYILQLSGDVQKAIDTGKKSISIYENKAIDSVFTATAKKTFLVNGYSQLSRSFLKIKEADSAKHYSTLISKLITPEDSCNQRVLYLTRGEIDFFEKNYSEAKKNFRTASKLCDLNSPLMTLRMNYALGKVAHGEGNFKEAKNILQNALDTYQVKPSEEGYMDDYYNLLAVSYKETGDLEKANFYFEKYIKSASEFDKIKGEVKAATKAKEIEAFRNELKTLEAEKKESQSNLNYLFLGASIIILGLLFLLLKFYRNKKTNEIKFEALLAKIKAAEKPENIIDTKDEVLEETNATDVSDEVKTQILDGLKKLEKQEYFLKQECNSYNVAKKINTNTSYLSKVINGHYGKNFNTYINDLRINYTILRLKNDVIFRSYSIQSIAEEVGYKSADSFTKYFKQDTGLNPSFYIKEIKNIT